MSTYKKQLRIVSLVESTSEALVKKTNAALEEVAVAENIEGAATGQTYRTYESHTSKNGKSFFNTPFFTNSITIAFVAGTSNEDANEVIAKIEEKLDKIGSTHEND